MFGCIAFANVPDAQRRKLDKKSEKLLFVGYIKETKGYRILDKKTSKVIIRRVVTFNETDFGYTEAFKSKETVEIDIDLEKGNELGQRPEDEHRHSEQQRQPPVKYEL